MKKIILILIFCVRYSFIIAQSKTILYQDSLSKIVFDHYENMENAGMPYTNVIYLVENGKNDTLSYPNFFPMGKCAYDGRRIGILYQLSNFSCYCIDEKKDNKWEPIFWHTSAVPRKMEGQLEYKAEVLNLLSFKEVMRDANGQTVTNLYEINMEKQEYKMYRLSLERGREVLKTFPFPVYRTKNEKK
jgi:hypothetical protein